MTYNICDATPQELEDFNNWLNHGGPNKKQIEAKKLQDLRSKIADECVMLIRNELDILQGYHDEGDYEGMCKKANCLMNIMNIIRGYK